MNTTIPVLLVYNAVYNDDAPMRDILLLSLKEAGYSVTVASSYKEGLKQLVEGSFKAVVSDMKLGDGNGVDIMEATIMHEPKIVRFLMGDGSEPKPHRANAFFLKHHGAGPLLNERLVSALKVMLRR